MAEAPNAFNDVVTKFIDEVDRNLAWAEKAASTAAPAQDAAG